MHQRPPTYPWPISRGQIFGSAHTNLLCQEVPSFHASGFIYRLCSFYRLKSAFPAQLFLPHKELNRLITTLTPPQPLLFSSLRELMFTSFLTGIDSLRSFEAWHHGWDKSSLVVTLFVSFQPAWVIFVTFADKKVGEIYIPLSIFKASFSSLYNSWHYTIYRTEGTTMNV